MAVLGEEGRLKPEFVLPMEIAEGATIQENEYGWSISGFPRALANAKALGYGCLGGQFQIRPDGGSVYELYWINADPGERSPGEPWSQYAPRSCSETLQNFQQKISSTNFKEEASWPELQAAFDQGLDLSRVLVFVADFVTEAEYDSLTKR